MSHSEISRTFATEDQLRFARASGDYNPMHTRMRLPRAARRQGRPSFTE